MRLKRVRINNFRSIRNATIDFDVSLRMLFGRNEAGKSNILKALSLLDATSVWDPNDTRTISADETDAEGRIWFEYELDNGDVAALVDTLEVQLFCSPNAVVAKEADKALDLNALVRRFMPVSWIGQGVKLSTTYYKLPPGITGLGYWMKLKFGAAGVSVTNGGKTNLVKPGMLAPVALASIKPESFIPAAGSAIVDFVGKAVSEYAKANMPPCLYWAYTPAYLLPGKIDISKFAGDPQTCIPLKNIFSLANIPDPAAAIKSEMPKQNGLSNLLKRVARTATEHLHKVWSEHKGVSLGLTTDGPNIVAVVQDRHNEYDFDRRSDGFKRFVAFLFTVSSQVKTGGLTGALILIDEPDTSLHPSGTRLLRKELAKLAKTNLVVASSHSVFMVDPNNIAEHLIVTKADEVTSVEVVEKSPVIDEEVIYDSLGASAFQFLKEKNIIFEGWRDKLMFRTALGKLRKRSSIEKKLSSIGVTHADGVKDIQKVAAILELGQRRFVVLSDSDGAALDRKKLWEYQAPWYCYHDLLPSAKSYTAEDFLTPQRIAKVLKAWADRQAEPPIGDWQQRTDTTVLEAIKQWLAPIYSDKARLKGAQSEIKEDLFKGLNAGDISDQYVEYLEALAEKLR